METGGKESKRSVGLGMYIATVIALLEVVGIGAYGYLNISSDLSELRQERQAQSIILQKLKDSYADLSSPLS